MYKTIWERMKETFGAEHEEGIVSVSEIKRRLRAKFPDTKNGSIIPSDHCYNIINVGIPFNRIPKLFLFVKNGKYRIVGEDYPYQGDIRWKGKKVGSWKGSPPMPSFDGIELARFQLEPRRDA